MSYAIIGILGLVILGILVWLLAHITKMVVKHEVVLQELYQQYKTTDKQINNS